MDDLLTTTQDLLGKTELTAEQIIQRLRAGGTSVGKSWLGALKAGRFKDPGVRKIQALHRVLSDAHSESGRAA